MVRLAALAPSGHNTQPWLFTAIGSEIRISADPTRRLPVVDPDDHALYISLGCALENLVISARHFGIAPRAALPNEPGREYISVTLEQGLPEEDHALFDAISVRQSTRCRYDGRPIPSEHLKRLESAATQESVGFRLFTGRQDIETLVGFVEEGSRAQFEDRAFVDELVSWIRFNSNEARAFGDGLWSAAMGLPGMPRWLGRLVMTRFVKPKSEARRQSGLVRSSSALALFTCESNDIRGWINVGRSLERVLLTAACLGIRHAHVNMPCEVPEVRRRMAREMGLAAEPLLLLRLGYSKPMPRSLRRPVEHILRFANQAPPY